MSHETPGIKALTEETKQNRTQLSGQEQPGVGSKDVAMQSETNPFLRCFTMINNTNFRYFINIELIPKSMNAELNFRIPKSQVSATLDPNKSLTVLTIMKIFPDKDWGEYDVICTSTILEKIEDNKHQDHRFY